MVISPRNIQLFENLVKIVYNHTTYIQGIQLC